MEKFLKSNLFESVELNEQKRMRTETVKRWNELGMLEGLNEGPLKDNIATLYENEAKMLLREATDASNSGSFETVVFPIIRRTFSKLLANDIVSVQALNLPVGKMFFILPVVSERTWTDAKGGDLNGDMLQDGAVGRHKGLMGYERTDRRNGNSYNRFYMADEALEGATQAYEMYNGKEWVAIPGATSYNDAIEKAAGATVRQVSPAVTQYQEKTLYDLFYNDFLFDNSKGKIHIRVVNAKDGFVEGKYWKNGKLEKVNSENDLRLYADGTVRNIILEVSGFSQYNAGKLIGPDGNEMDTEVFLPSLKVVAGENIGTDDKKTCFAKNEAIPYRVVTQKYGKGIVEYNSTCDANGKIYIDLDLSKPCSTEGGTIDGYIGVSAVDAFNAIENLKIAWCQYDSLELETEIGEVSFKLSSVTVDVEESKLRATWSPEMSQDVAAFHNIDAEAELTSLLSEEIAGEIDRLILRDLRHVGPWQRRWDVNGWRRMAGFSTNYTQKDWNQELITACNQISGQIHKAALHGGASWIVVSSEISALLDSLEYFHVSDASPESDQYNMGIERIGSLSGRYQVYRDPYSPAWSMIIGHRGKSLLDTGYIYAPYIPMQLTPTVTNPDNFAPVKGIMTRYAKKCVNNKFYGGVRVDGLVTWDINEFR